MSLKISGLTELKIERGDDGLQLTTATLPLSDQCMRHELLRHEKFRSYAFMRKLHDAMAAQGIEFDRVDQRENGRPVILKVPYQDREPAQVSTEIHDLAECLLPPHRRPAQD